MANRRKKQTLQHPLDQKITAAVQAGSHPVVEVYCRQKLALSPDDPFANLNLGISLVKQGRFKEAVAVYQDGLTYHPDNPLLHARLANSLGECLRWHEAYDHAKRATALAPHNAECWNSLPYPAYMLGHYKEGEDAARHALQLTQDPLICCLNWANLGSCLRDQGRLEEAAEAYRQATRLLPDYEIPYINLLLTTLSLEHLSITDYLQDARTYATRFEAPLMASWPDFTERDASPWRRLEIGFISPDLRNHAVMYFAESLMALLDRRWVTVTAFYLQSGEDQVTQRVRRIVDRFVVLDGLQPREQAARITDLRIDILIDLAGYTAKTGLRSMMYKPAPIQVTWMGFPATTGLGSIDWRITDYVADPPGADTQYTEKLARLPAPFCVYRPWLRMPICRYLPAYQVKPAPALANGYVTFGSCNNLAKLTDHVLQTWALILKNAEGARLLVEGMGLEDMAQRTTFTTRCAAAGIPLDRLDCLARENRNQYLTYHRIDIALDPFPLTGGTTSFDLLWMGVPLVTMIGDSFRSRMGVSLLTAAGLTEWIAKDEEEYVEIAVRLAADVPALHARRMQQRRLIETGPLMDEHRFTRFFEEALRQMWLKWCVQRVADNAPAARQRLLEQYLAERPQTCPAETYVYFEPGMKHTLQEARRMLQQAYAALPQERQPHHWQELVKLATLILESVPKEPRALTVLAEAEYTHGDRQAAIAYLAHAIEASPQEAALYRRLCGWMAESGNHEGVAQIRQLMQVRGIPQGEII